jgi:type I restriction enzyme S subunit
MSELPTGWTAVRLDDLCDLNPRDSAPATPDALVSFVPMPAVCEKEGTILPHQHRPFAEVSKGYTRFRDEDVIFAKITPCMENGKIAIARGLHNGTACGSTEFHVLRSRGSVLPSYLWRFLRQSEFRQLAERHMTGAVGQRRVPVQFLRDTAIPLPPIAERRRVVAKLDALSARSGSARTELDRIRDLTKRYKQAVLAAAFRGDLTADWRVTNNASFRDSWRDSSLGELAVDVRYGTAAKCHYEPKATPVLRISNVAAGRINTADLKYATFDRKAIEKLSLQVGDLLVIRSNGSLDLVGRAALVTEDVSGYLYAGYLIRFRFDQTRVDPKFAVLAFEEPSLRAGIERLGKSTSGVNNINSEQLRNLHLPVPSLQEQKEVVSRVDVAFAHIDSLTADAARATALLDRLDQAILAKAFRGGLLNNVPGLAMAAQ